MSDDRFAAHARQVRRTRLKRIGLGLLALAVTSTLVWVIWFSSLLSVRDVEVDGQTTLKAAQVREAAAVPLGRPLARLNIAQIEARVASMERVESVDVTRSWPRGVHVEVVERKPVMTLEVAGEIRAVDRYGIDFRTYSTAPKGLVKATITATDQRRRLQATAAAAGVVHLLQTKDAALLRQVQSVSAGTKDSIELNLTRGRTLVWGSEADGTRKVQVLKALLKIKAARYDVSAPDQPTTTR